MNSNRWRIAWPWLALVLAGVLAVVVRYGLIEPPTLAHQCDDGVMPWWCGWRQALVIGFTSYGYGIAALLVSGAALFSKRVLIAWLGAALGVFALVLYCYNAGALALLVGCLRLLRVQADRHAMGSTPSEQHWQRNRQIQRQP